jgi:hypothetical protein
MNAGSPRVRRLWRGLALTFALAVVSLRLAAAAGCGSTGGAAAKKARATPSTVTAKAGATPAPPGYIADPDYLPATKSGGGFAYPVDLSDNPKAQPQQAAPQQAPKTSR